MNPLNLKLYTVYQGQVTETTIQEIQESDYQFYCIVKAESPEAALKRYNDWAAARNEGLEIINTEYGSFKGLYQFPIPTTYYSNYVTQTDPHIRNIVQKVLTVNEPYDKAKNRFTYDIILWLKQQSRIGGPMYYGPYNMEGMPGYYSMADDSIVVTDSQLHEGIDSLEFGKYKWYITAETKAPE